MTVNLKRCRICGEVNLFETSPTRCPYCAVASSYLQSSDDFSSNENRIQPTETERRDLEDLTEVVRALARSALGAADATLDDARASLLRRISWIQAEQVRVLCLLADESTGPEWLQPLSVEDDKRVAIQGIDMRLAEAAALYERAAGRATAPRAREVAAAFAEAERRLALVPGL